MKPDLPEIPGLEKLFIAGEWLSPETDRKQTIVCPADEEVVATVALPAMADADKAVSAAREAFDRGKWPRMKMSERVNICSRLAEALEKRLERLNVAWMLESGAPLAHGEMINSGAARQIWRNAIEIAGNLELEETRSKPGGDVLIFREPVGTVLGVLTYNGPIVLMGMKIIPALLAGCPVIIKHPPESALTARLIAEAVEEAGFPPGVISMLAADTEVTQYLVGHEGIDMVALTGGTAIGVDVVHRTADRLARTVLELGGKSPAIIADDADLDAALPTIVEGATGFVGQVCVSLSRILVSEQRHAEVVEKLAEAYKNIKVGMPWDSGADRGPLAVERARQRSENAVARAVEQGAKIEAGGKRPPHLDRGWYYEPTLLSNVDNSMEIAQEEVFGPVTAVISYRDLDEAIEIANDTKFGLAASIFTADDKTALSVARRLRSGGVAINTAGISLTEPFGGVKQSGWGRECGAEGILEFTDIKQVILGGSYLNS